jgi:ribosomal protein S12 methylthiotransferase
MRARKSPPRPKSIHFVSLGCPKNRVDSEVMLGLAEADGFKHTDDAEDAEVIVVNTCGFIDAAKQESIDTILQLSRLKEAGSCKKLVVTGCLSQRYPDVMAAEMPEVDHFLGSSDMRRLPLVLREGAPRVWVGNPADWVMGSEDPRTLSTRGASAYLKIAEGCNRNCGFCVIPQIRGKQRSRDPEDIVAEAEQLAERGVLELNLVSQDTIAYGRDRDGKVGLAELIERLGEVNGIEWLRLHYLYPEKLNDRLLELLAQHPKVVPYIDMPLQHAAPAMLKRMLRGGSTQLRPFIERLRQAVPSVVLRSAFIVGHPGETDAEFAELMAFVRWAELDHVGVFQYSDEETCTSHALSDKVPAQVAEERAGSLLDLQRDISLSKNEARVGQRLKVLVEGASEESELVMVGRHAGQAPEVDGVVYLSHGPVQPGRFCYAEVVTATNYDLLAEAEPNDEPSDDAPKPARKAPGSSLVKRRKGQVTLRTVS